MAKHSPHQSASVAFFSDLYKKVFGLSSVVSSVIAGHLAIEFLLRKLIALYDVRLAAHADDLTHARLIALSRDVGALTDAQAAVLVQINQLRNKLAHQISYSLSINELRVLCQGTASAFSDFTDGVSQGVKSLEEATSAERLDHRILPELFLRIAYALHHEYLDRGGDQELF